jgi:hypothetical protein
MAGQACIKSGRLPAAMPSAALPAMTAPGELALFIHSARRIRLVLSEAIQYLYAAPGKPVAPGPPVRLRDAEVGGGRSGSEQS